MRNKLKFSHLFAILPYVLVFVASLYQPSDADLGWHLKYGEDFVKTGEILRENTFSTEMTDFLWPNISWGIDILNYLVFSAGGFLGLTLAGAFTVTLTFYFFAKAFELSSWQKAVLFPLLLVLEHPLNQVSFRGSLVSLLLLSILSWLLFSYERKPTRRIWFVVPLLLLWANLHGMFILGLGVLGLWLFGRVLNTALLERKLLVQTLKLSVLLFSLSIIATLVHPFGFAIYEDALIHFNNPLLKDIAEYLPFDELSQLWWLHMIVSCMVAIGIFFLVLHEGIQKHVTKLLTVLPLLSATFFIRRYAWSGYYLSIPFLKPIADFFKPDSKKATEVAATVLLTVAIGVAILTKLPLSQNVSMSWGIFCTRYYGCSDGAAQYLLQNKPEGKLLTLYNWGGWLIWNYPQLKPSIDGRMHLWEDEKGYSSFKEYYALEQNRAMLESSNYDVVLMSPNKPLYKQLRQLAKNGRWDKVYEDKYAGIFVRKTALDYTR